MKFDRDEHTKAIEAAREWLNSDERAGDIYLDLGRGISAVSDLLAVVDELREQVLDPVPSGAEERAAYLEAVLESISVVTNPGSTVRAIADRALEKAPGRRQSDDRNPR